MNTELQDATQATKALTDLREKYEQGLPELETIDGWWRWDPQKLLLKDPSREHRTMRDISETPWLRMVVTTLAQTLYLDGVEFPDDIDNTKAKRMWMPWNRNRMGAKQIPLHQAAIAYGSAYTSVHVDADGLAKITCHTPMRALALYNDPASDVFPQLFLAVIDLSDDTTAYEVWDAWNVWRFQQDKNGTLSLMEPKAHGVCDAQGEPVCPVVRFGNQIDLQGRTPGEVEPYIPLAKRLNKDNYDRLLAQHYNSWKVKTATGIDLSELDDDAKEQRKLEMRQDSMLFGGEGVQFGTLPETDLDNIVNAKQSDVDELAAVSQTPATAFGKMVNVGDAGIEESRAGFYAKRNERRKTFGVSHLDTLRLCAAAEGRMDDAANMGLTPVWADTDTRTISQAVDAFGKAAQMLGVPKQCLWDKIPGVTKTEADSWREYAEAHPDADELAARIYGEQLQPTGE